MLKIGGKWPDPPVSGVIYSVFIGLFTIRVLCIFFREMAGGKLDAMQIVDCFLPALQAEARHPRSCRH